MQFYSKASLQLIYDQVNRDNPNLPIPLSDNNVALKGTVTASASGAVRNSQVTFVGLPGKGYRGQLTLLFDRVNLSQLYQSSLRPIIYFPSGVTTQAEGLSVVNAILGLSLTTTDLLTPTASMVPTATATDTQMQISASSPAFIGFLFFTMQTERIGYFPRSGPGTKYLTYGDVNFGYFGKVSSTELYTRAELFDVLLTGKGTTATRASFTDDWYKFYYKGKVVFIPQSPIAANVTWNALYNLGYIYGIDGVGAYPTATPVSQSRNISSKKTGEAFYFKVRTPTSAPKDPDGYLVGSPGQGNYAGSELELMVKLYNGQWGKETGSHWSQYCMFLETMSNSALNSRLSTMSAGNWSVIAKSTSNASWYWFPVLELIDLAKTVVPLETITGTLEYTILPLPAVVEQNETLFAPVFGIPKTIDFQPVAALPEPTTMELHPTVLGIPKTVDYRPVAATSDQVVVTKTDLSGVNGELDGF